jgi:ABC-type Zn2+ transport system substrate-binding protein/surface adhesin
VSLQRQDGDGRHVSNMQGKSDHNWVSGEAHVWLTPQSVRGGAVLLAVTKLGDDKAAQAVAFTHDEAIAFAMAIIAVVGETKEAGGV